MLKIYGIQGKTQAVIKFPLNNGKAYLQCEFKHGRIGAGQGNRPCTYATTDVTEQNIIENSEFYKNKSVFLHRGEACAPAEQEAPKELEYVASVTSKEEVISYLKGKGAKATNLKDDASIKKFMDKIGVAFPNFDF